MDHRTSQELVQGRRHVAHDPAPARTVRVNMYLHDDGGSRIYQFHDLAIRWLGRDEQFHPQSERSVP